MEAPEGDPGRSTPSGKLLDVWRCIGELGVTGAASSPAQTTENGPGAAVNANAGFVKRLREWYEAADSTVVDLGDVINLQPQAELGGATFDVLLHFFDLRDIVKELWPRAPGASGGLLLPLLFRFFGFYDPNFVTSARQLYRSVRPNTQLFAPPLLETTMLLHWFSNSSIILTYDFNSRITLTTLPTTSSACKLLDPPEKYILIITRTHTSCHAESPLKILAKAWQPTSVSP
jgi:hypothetical protein